MQNRYKKAKNITLIGGVINCFLGFAKLLGGFLFHSHALIADGIHSFADLITDAMVLFASKYGSQDADATHPYGHQRIETAATLFLALLLILAGLGIAWSALNDLSHVSRLPPQIGALWIALFSMFINELLFYYTRAVGKKIQSALITANAWHHRSDAAASLIVALGLIGSLKGLVYLDTIAALIVGFLIIKMGINYGWRSVTELVDTAINVETLCQIEQTIQGVDGVKKIHQLRSRLMGQDILIDVHILVDPYISVSEGHFIAQHVHQTLMQQFKRIKDVIVHVDPEDDEKNCPSLHLANRKTLEQTLLNPWKQQFSDLSSWTLHYLDGTIRLDLIFKKDSTQISDFKKKMRQDLINYPVIYVVRLLSEIEK